MIEVNRDSTGAIFNPTKWYSRTLQSLMHGHEFLMIVQAIMLVMMIACAAVAAPITAFADGNPIAGSIWFFVLFALIGLSAVAIKARKESDTPSFLIDVINAYNAMPRAKRKEYKAVMNQCYDIDNCNDHIAAKELFELYRAVVHTGPRIDISALLRDARADHHRNAEALAEIEAMTNKYLRRS